MDQNRKIYRLTVETADIDAFLRACEDAEWYAMDTGERVLTDEGPDAEAVLLVEPVPRQGIATAKPIVH